MPENVRALIVILMVVLPLLVGVRRAFVPGAISSDDFARRSRLWILVTVAAFLSHNFWLFVAVAAGALVVANKRESNVTGLYFFLLFAVPPIALPVPGLGIVNYLFDIHYHRLLAIVLLLPTFFSLVSEKSTPRFGSLRPDRWLGAYLGLQLVLILAASTVTHALRVGLFYAFVDVMLPYFVISRSLTSIEKIRDALASFLVAALLLCPLAAIESLRHWLLYSSVGEAMSVTSEVAVYIERGDGGLLRALTSAGHPIALGFVLMIALGFLFPLRGVSSGWENWLFGLLLLVAGLLATLSRGPWLGALVIAVVYFAIGTKYEVLLRRVSYLGLFGAFLLIFTPIGDQLKEFFLDVGNWDETFLYRARLLEVGMQVMIENPLVGAFDFIYSPAMEEMRQGQGIIDIVNTYLAIGLGSGLLGLAGFIGFFLAIAVGIREALHTTNGREQDCRSFGRAIIAALVGALIVLGTVSSVMVIPRVYWALAGVGVAYYTVVNMAGRVSLSR